MAHAYVYQPLENHGLIRIIQLGPAASWEMELECEILECCLEENSGSVAESGPVRSVALTPIINPRSEMTNDSV